jgi:hypothetical protein
MDKIGLMDMRMPVPSRASHRSRRYRAQRAPAEALGVAPARFPLADAAALPLVESFSCTRSNARRTANKHPRSQSRASASRRSPDATESAPQHTRSRHVPGPSMLST